METIERLTIKYDRTGFTDEQLKKLYHQIVLPRLIEERMLISLRQGLISKWFSGFGQEAISVGAAAALDSEEFILPMHRNLGVFTTREIPLRRLFSQFQGKMNGFTKGRDRSFHFGSKEYHLVGMISHLGPQLGIADGIALGNLLKDNKKTTLVFSGDGGASEGDFHESLNVAAVWSLPVIFVVENNSWGLSTPSSEQFKCKQFIDKGIGYGMEAIQIDGNNILEVYKTINNLSESLKENPRPILLEAMTFRMRGHEEASGTKYYPAGLQDTWSSKDPVNNYEQFLVNEGIFKTNELESIKEDLRKHIKAELKIADQEPAIIPNKLEELADMYASYTHTASPAGTKTSEIRYIDAITAGLKEAMTKHDDLVLMGQDIADYGGVFKVTDGFVDLFGKHRVRNTPLCESAIVGTALGLSINGMKAMMEMQFADFVTCGFNQIINNLAKIHYRWGQKADVVVRMPTGGTTGAGPFHSQSNEAWFFHTPGLKIAYPAFPADAKGLLLESFEDPNPVMFFEHKAMYRNVLGEVPEGYYTIPFGKAATVNEGSDITIITYGMGVHWALKAAKEMHEVSMEIVDLRTLAPLDTEAIYTAAKKTGKVIVLHEDNVTGGIGAEISALITENCFETLDAPVMRCASMDTAIPFAADLEKQYMAVGELTKSIKDLINY
jgi:2-oxoisovalerate dehydrogenase E1 component